MVNNKGAIRYRVQLVNTKEQLTTGYKLNASISSSSSSRQHKPFLDQKAYRKIRAIIRANSPNASVKANPKMADTLYPESQNSYSCPPGKVNQRAIDPCQIDNFAQMAFLHDHRGGMGWYGTDQTSHTVILALMSLYGKTVLPVLYFPLNG